MSTQQWIELAGIVAGGGGAGRLIAKMTRLAVAVEELVKSHGKLVDQVAQHEARLNKGGIGL